MHPQLEKLVQLQRTETRLKELQAALDDVPRQRDAQEQALLAERGRLDAARSELEHSQRTRRPITCSPMTRGLQAMRISSAMMGTATTPLMTADQNSSLTGSVGVKHRITPTTVAAAITP